MAEEKRIKIKNVEKLLSGIASGLKELDGHKPRVAVPVRSDMRLSCIEVVFWRGAEVVGRFGLATALEYLAEDIYYDAENDWSDADNATVEVIQMIVSFDNDPDGKKLAAHKEMCAKAIKLARLLIDANVLRYSWEQEQEDWREFVNEEDTETLAGIKNGTIEVCWCALETAWGDNLASVGGITLCVRQDTDTKNYIREIEDELAIEAYDVLVRYVQDARIYSAPGVSFATLRNVLLARETVRLSKLDRAQLLAEIVGVPTAYVEALANLKE